MMLFIREVYLYNLIGSLYIEAQIISIEGGVYRGLKRLYRGCSEMTWVWVSVQVSYIRTLTT